MFAKAKTLTSWNNSGGDIWNLQKMPKNQNLKGNSSKYKTKTLTIRAAWSN